MNNHLASNESEARYFMTRAITEAWHATKAQSSEAAELHQQLAGAYLAKVVVQRDAASPIALGQG